MTTDNTFRYISNKAQYELNNKVVDKIEAALSSNDDVERVSVLNEGKNLLSERNKHILLAEKFVGMQWNAIYRRTSRC